MNTKQAIETLDVLIEEAKNPKYLNKLKVLFEEFKVSFSSKSVKQADDFFSESFQEIKEGDNLLLNQIKDDFDKFTTMRNYGGDIFTIQEHHLMGSTQGKKGDDFYIPMLILNGEQDVKKVERLRNLVSFNKALHSFYGLQYFNGSRSYLNITLESLDKKARTIRDPILLNDNFEIVNYFRKTEDFPYRMGDEHNFICAGCNNEIKAGEGFYEGGADIFMHCEKSKKSDGIGKPKQDCYIAYTFKHSNNSLMDKNNVLVSINKIKDFLEQGKTIEQIKDIFK